MKRRKEERGERGGREDGSKKNPGKVKFHQILPPSTFILHPSFFILHPFRLVIFVHSTFKPSFVLIRAYPRLSAAYSVAWSSLKIRLT